jgi:hypothetical protein
MAPWIQEEAWGTWRPGRRRRRAGGPSGGGVLPPHRLSSASLSWIHGRQRGRAADAEDVRLVWTVASGPCGEHDADAGALAVRGSGQWVMRYVGLGGNFFFWKV